MRIVILAFGTWGDIRPNVLIGQALQERGYEVIVIASIGFEDWVKSHHLNYIPLSVNVQDVIDKLSTDTLNFFQAYKAIRELLAPAMFQLGVEVSDVLQDGDVFLTHESGVSILSGVIESRKIKTIRVNFQPLHPTQAFPSPGVPKFPDWLPMQSTLNKLTYNIIIRTQWSLLGSRGNELRKKHLNMKKMKWKQYLKMIDGMPAVTCVSQHVIPRPFDWHENYHMTGFLFDHEDSWTPPIELSDFINTGDAPIYIGFGSMGDPNPEKTTRTLLEAIKLSGQRAIILSGWAGIGSANIPDNVYILKYAPHSWLFPHMLAIVHHGGAGTTAAALRSGIPSIIVPHNGDQPFWGNHVYQLGAGAKTIPRNQLTAENLSTAIHEVISSQSMRETAQAIGVRIRSEDSIQNALSVIESVIRG